MAHFEHFTRGDCTGMTQHVERKKDKNGNYVTKGEQLVIDDGGNYDSECAYCFMEHVMEIDILSKDKVRKKIK